MCARTATRASSRVAAAVVPSATSARAATRTRSAPLHRPMWSSTTAWSQLDSWRSPLIASPSSRRSAVSATPEGGPQRAGDLVGVAGGPRAPRLGDPREHLGARGAACRPRAAPRQDAFAGEEAQGLAVPLRRSVPRVVRLLREGLLRLGARRGGAGRHVAPGRQRLGGPPAERVSEPLAQARRVGALGIEHGRQVAASHERRRGSVRVSRR